MHATASKITDLTIHQLIDKIRVDPLPSSDAARYRQGATVTIRTRDDRTGSSTVYVPKGAGASGINWADVDAKYRALMPQSLPDHKQIEASLAVIHEFCDVRHVSEPIDLLGPPTV